MIVDPDFLDHWRTRVVFDMLGEDQSSPLYILRIWAHCQARKATSFTMSAIGLKALCRFKGDAETLESSLIEAGFVVRDGVSISVPKWAEHNAKLIANWENGGKGGRPIQTQEEPKDNPKITQPEPTVTHEEPIRDRLDLEDSKTTSKTKTERGSRLTQSWEAPVEYIDFCKAERPELDPKAMEDKFRDYWSGVPGKGGLKLDWLGTWRNFVRSERGSPQPRASPQPVKFDPVAHVNRNRIPP